MNLDQEKEKLEQTLKRKKATHAKRPAWSPDGTTILFQEGDQICVMDADGPNLFRMCKGSEPAWSPDGGKIAFVDYTGYSRGGSIWRHGRRRLRPR